MITSRSPDKGAAAAARLERITSAGDVRVVELDLARMASVHDASDALHAQFDGFDAVINNAGVMQTPQQETADGFELQLGTNHLGHFLLNSLVVDLVQARAGRIVPVSSIAHQGARGINFDDPMFTTNYSPTKAYSQSKLANLMYGLELARRLEAAGSSMMSVIAHPGYSDTNLQSAGPRGPLKTIYRVTNKVMAQSGTDGARPVALAAAGREAVNGGYYGPTKFGSSRGPVGDSKVSQIARDESQASRLWTLSEDLLGITWDVEASVRG